MLSSDSRKVAVTLVQRSSPSRQSGEIRGLGRCVTMLSATMFAMQDLPTDSPEENIHA